MKYTNTTKAPIYIQVKGVTQLINAGQDIISDSSLLEYGLTAFPEKEVKIPTPPPMPKKTSKTVKTNELPKSNKPKN
tara:strand:+ start:203 stop:433 length:231 start_codon:yes stop_codon:yes gene_type:complete